MPAIHVSVAGRVQGVGFRWFVRDAARRLGLSGWVRNCPDGTVEVAASGSEDALGEFRTLLSRGPESAMVTALNDLPAVHDGLDHPFAMKR